MIVNPLDHLNEDGTICTLPVGTYLFRMAQTIEFKPKTRYSEELEQCGVFMSTCIYLPMMMIPENRTLYNFLSVYVTTQKIELSFLGYFKCNDLRDTPLKHYIVYSGPLHGVFVRNSPKFDIHTLEVHIPNSEGIEFCKSYFVTHRMWCNYCKLLCGDKFDPFKDVVVEHINSYDTFEFLADYSKYECSKLNDTLIVPECIPRNISMVYDYLNPPRYDSNLCVRARYIDRDYSKQFHENASEVRVTDEHDGMVKIYKFDYEGEILRLTQFERLVFR